MNRLGPTMTLGNSAEATLRLLFGARCRLGRAGLHRACNAIRQPHRASRLALLLVFAVISTLGIARGQDAPGTPIVSDVRVAGGTERVLFLGAEESRALLVLLPGGDGILGLDNGGAVHQLGSNFLVRTLAQWVAQGFAVLLPDAPNGTSLLGQRHLPAYADMNSNAIDFGRSRANLPVWLIGTSQGSTAAANGAAHLGSKVSGVVLTSPVTRIGSADETVFVAEPGAIAVPVLVVSNQDDTCAESPPSGAAMVVAAVTHSPRKQLAMVGSRQFAKGSDPCRGMSPHGYLGIEGMVVQRISEWIRMVGGR
jgi:hypothetical protein